MRLTKRRSLVIAFAAAAVIASSLVWHLRHQQPAQPAAAAAPSKAELIRLANIARRKKDGIIAPLKKSDSTRGAEEQAATKRAMPARDTSLTLMDLSRVPTEAELIKAGQLGEPLSPTASADPAGISDPVLKAQQEADNLLFGKAMNAWNSNRYTESLPFFYKHLRDFPRSPWKAESHLHLGLASLQQGYPPGGINQADAVMKTATKGTAAYQKALLLKASALVQEQQMDEAAKVYSEILTTETDARRRSMAASWLLALSQSRKKQS